MGVLGAATVVLVLAWACGAPQVPPGPPPEYERPAVIPWDAGPVEDPLANIESSGEWVDEDEPSGGGAAPVPGRAPGNRPDAEVPGATPARSANPDAG